MFGDNNSQDQNQHNVPVSTAPLSDTAASASVNDSNQSPAESSVPVTTVPPGTSVFGQTSAASTADGNDLLDIKQQALQQLSPLVGQLEQSPEEKFRTTMMMIQASDDQSLIKDAFESAKQITDDKARAQALLDVINEINYFTQQKK